MLDQLTALLQDDLDEVKTKDKLRVSYLGLRHRSQANLCV
jgi:hypothetical protein